MFRPALRALALVLLASPACADNFSKVVVFGDSNVDSGFYRALPNPGGGATINGMWASAVTAGAGAPTSNPAPVNSHVLATLYGLTATPANTAGGTNYATSGAKNQTVNNSQTGGFQQAVPTVTQISNFLAANSNIADSGALYFIHSGDNDVSYAVGDQGQGPYPASPNAYVTQAANDLITAIVSLKTAGARKFLISGLAYDYPGNDPTKRALKLLYTNTLWNGLASAGVDFYRGDINVMRNIITANPSRFGFTMIGNGAAQTACTQPAGVAVSWSLVCAPSGPSSYVNANAPEERLFADDSHLAAKGQRLMGSFLYRTLNRATLTRDFGGDGNSDILWRDAGGNLVLWSMSGATAVGNQAVGNVPTNWTILALRQFNGDNTTDVLWRDNAGNTALWMMDGPAASANISLGVIPTNWSVAGTGDFNQDGKGDILWRDEAGNTALWMMNGGAVIANVNLGNVPPSWQVAATGDFTGDGKTDILWRDPSGNFALWGMKGGTVVSNTFFGNFGTVWNVVASGDFDSNGTADLVWRDAAGNTVLWLLSNGGAQVVNLGNVPPSWSVAATGDYNGDRKSDILWRSTAGDIVLWLMNGTSLLSSNYLGVVPASWTVQAGNGN